MYTYFNGINSPIIVGCFTSSLLIGYVLNYEVITQQNFQIMPFSRPVKRDGKRYHVGDVLNLILARKERFL